MNNLLNDQRKNFGKSKIGEKNLKLIIFSLNVYFNQIYRFNLNSKFYTKENNIRFQI